MAVNNDDNKKLPETPGKVTGNKDVRYFTIHHSVDGTGSQHYSPFDLGESKQYSFDEWWSSTGGYKSREAHKKTEMTTSLKYEHRAHNIGGHSQSGEASGQSFFNDTFSKTTVGDSGEDVGGNHLLGVLKAMVHGALGGKAQVIPQNSFNPSTEYSSGDKNFDTDGSNYNSVGQSRVSVVKQDDVTIVNNGDSALHVQSGNWDTHIAQKGRLYTENDLLIESATKITLKVGGSTIVIEPNHITVVSAKIDLNP